MKRSLLLAALIMAVVSVVMNPIGVGAQQTAADKAAASASDLDKIDLNQSDVVLRQNMSVSDTADLILDTTAECSILTSLYTAGGADTGPDTTRSETDGAFGQVEMWITLDDKRVPVATDDAGDGEVVFCNRAYQRTVVDKESPEDGIDSEDDFIRTRTANGFNWMAFDVGRDQETGGYDKGHDNDIEMQLHARYTRSNTDGNQSCGAPQADSALAPYGKTCSDAFVGSRTLIAQVVHAINNEQADAGGQ